MAYIELFTTHDNSDDEGGIQNRTFQGLREILDGHERPREVRRQVKGRER
jgi:hypothetical protein